MGQDQAALDRYSIEQLAKMSAANLTEKATQDRADRVLTNARIAHSKSAWGTYGQHAGR